jgi:phosphoribosyl-ATP pyrophosphohydrolase/phosphoribosyl-AMP cyclohydrolase
VKKYIEKVSLVSNLKYNEKGLIPAIVQDADTGEVLMMGYMNEESLRRTLKSREVWFYSRSRQELWHKGKTSGNKLIVRELWRDCDSDVILVKANPTGPVCHTGHKTCFFQELTEDDLEKTQEEA